MSNPLATAVEQAFVAILSPVVGSQAAVVPGMSSGVKTLPLVICGADGSSQEEDPRGTGNFWVDVEITVKATAATESGAVDDPKVAAVALTALVFNALLVSNLDALLNATGQPLTVLPNGFFFSSPKQGQDGDGVWVDVLPIKVYCCNSILLP